MLDRVGHEPGCSELEMHHETSAAVAVGGELLEVPPGFVDALHTLLAQLGPREGLQIYLDAGKAPVLKLTREAGVPGEERVYRSQVVLDRMPALTAVLGPDPILSLALNQGRRDSASSAGSGLPCSAIRAPPARCCAARSAGCLAHGPKETAVNGDELDREAREALALGGAFRPVFEAVRDLLPAGTHFSVVVQVPDDGEVCPVALHTDRNVMLPLLGWLFLHAAGGPEPR